MPTKPLLTAVLASLLVCAVGSSARAQPDVSGSVGITEDQGFPPICNQPCFTATKDFEVYLAGNASVPAGANCPAGESTYIYQISHTGGAGPNIPDITDFELMVETDDVSSAGHIAGFGINSSSTVVGTNDVVTWNFTNPTLSNGQTTTKLFVCSRLHPGDVTDNTVSTSAQFSLDAVGTCVGPLFEPPSQAEPLPCTIGWWKNRFDGKRGTLKFFPGSDFDAAVERAVTLSNGIFPDANALLSDLASKGSRPIAQRARQQLAAFLLNLAGGDLFPENTKCKLDESNQISSNACGSDISVGAGLQEFFDDYAAGRFGEAKDCADDTNNGIGVVGVNSGE